jgi:predicted GIY-YIG superfamily endonuclease
VNPDHIRVCIEVRKMLHDAIVRENSFCFTGAVPRDHAAYAYTYYDYNDNPIYHGYTTNALNRAKEHRSKAPWATWVTDVRYRKCRSAHSARKLESRLQRFIPSLCHVNGLTRTYHGENWSILEDKYKDNHVTGTCRQPGGLCDPAVVIEWLSSYTGLESAA